ncbi:hypothetical protein KVR01_012753 [Diaporthe batatas]|uniref:uncharacterized protein n=1 Tax=Diaporthe batatas TaxID=748121 RepID=UPI001D043819|nr:uncharacterized protein KVR01_012753 [Diaporthe batatas]KAG8157369.1 hypothetical protein KVR01_012753 [Diaporthe batatas]
MACFKEGRRLHTAFPSRRPNMLFLTILAAANAALVGATPSRVAPRAAACTPKAGGSSSIDDVPAIQSAIAECASGTIVFPAGTTYYINSVLSLAGCKGCTLQVEGVIKVSSDTEYWNGKTAIVLAQNIDGLTVTSTTGSGVFDGNGQASWDKFATDTSFRRPTLFYVTGSKNVKMSNLSFKDAPNVFHSVTGGSSNVAYTKISLSAVSKSSNLPKNTDGWDIGSSTHVTINGATVANQDDCVAFKPGADHVEIYDISCAGSHGISVGSLGSRPGTTDTVSNVFVSGARMSTSTKAAGIKLYAGGASYGTAVVSNVTFKDFTVPGTDYAFQVQSCYNSDAAYCASNPSAAKISGVVVSGFSGTTSTRYAPVVANINCPKAGSCGIAMSGMAVKAGSGTATYLCANTPGSLGVTCSSGASG